MRSSTEYYDSSLFISSDALTFDLEISGMVLNECWFWCFCCMLSYFLEFDMVLLIFLYDENTFFLRNLQLKSVTGLHYGAVDGVHSNGYQTYHFVI